MVVGVLNLDGSVNTEQLHRIRQTAQGLVLTFHRAIDVCNSYMEALEDTIACKCDRILTSGQQSSALRGTVLLYEYSLVCYYYII